LLLQRMCSPTSIRSLRGRARGRRSPMLSWSRWRSVRRRWGSAATGSFSAWSATGSPLVSYIPSQSQYHRRLRALTGLLTVVQQRLARLLDAGGARLTDGTLIGVANYAGSAAHSEFAGVAAYGFCGFQERVGLGRAARAPHRPAWAAAQLHARARERARVRAAARPRRLRRDCDRRQRGLWGRAYNERMQCVEVLLTPARERTAANHGRERTLAGLRLKIESVFSNLKGQMRLERHLAKTPRGLAQRIAQRLLALTLGILLNTIAGRPARALAAYTAANSHQASSNSERLEHGLGASQERRRQLSAKRAYEPDPGPESVAIGDLKGTGSSIWRSRISTP
jgi:hypothetical protein